LYESKKSKEIELYLFIRCIATKGKERKEGAKEETRRDTEK
jgi:hypothetical protein